jgi:hypothetical protein
LRLLRDPKAPAPTEMPASMLLRRCFLALMTLPASPVWKTERSRFRGLCPTGATGLEPATPGFGVRSWAVFGAAFPLFQAVSVTPERLRPPQLGTSLGTDFAGRSSLHAPSGLAPWTKRLLEVVEVIVELRRLRPGIEVLIRGAGAGCLAAELLHDPRRSLSPCLGVVVDHQE